MGLFDTLASAVERKSTDVSNFTWGELFPQTNAKSGVSVNVDTSLRVTTVFACARVIAEGIAQLPKNIYELAPDGLSKTLRNDHPAYQILAHVPNEWMTSFELFEMMTMHAVLTGNAFAYLGWSGGKIIDIVPLVPNSVQVVRLVDWTLQYYVTDLTGQTTILDQTNILHLRGPSWNGYLGLDAIQTAREAIGLAISTEETHASLHANGAQPGGVLAVKGKLDQPARERLKAAWQTFQGGVANRFKTAVIDVDATWSPLAMTGVDSQHLETRRFQIEEICRAMRVFPQLVMHSDKTSTFASADAFFLAHVTHSLMPWIIRWEQMINKVILADNDNLVCKLNVQALLRGDVQARGDFYMKALGGARGETAYMTRNEVRALEDMNPIAGGDKLMIPPPPADPNLGNGSKSYSDSEPREADGKRGVGAALASYGKAFVINTALSIFGLDILPDWAMALIIHSAKSSDVDLSNFSEEQLTKLHGELLKSLDSDSKALLLRTLAGKKYSADQPRAPNGQFGSGGTVGTGPYKPGSGFVGVAKAVLHLAIESGAAKLVVITALRVFGTAILPEWAILFGIQMLIGSLSGTEEGKSQHFDLQKLLDGLSPEQFSRLAKDIVASLDDDQQVNLMNQVDGSKSFFLTHKRQIKYNPDQPRAPNGQFGSGGSGGTKGAAFDLFSKHADS